MLDLVNPNDPKSACLTAYTVPDLVVGRRLIAVVMHIAEMMGGPADMWVIGDHSTPTVFTFIAVVSREVREVVMALAILLGFEVAFLSQEVQERLIEDTNLTHPEAGKINFWPEGRALVSEETIQ